MVFDQLTLVSTPFEVWDAPIAVRAFGLTGAMAVQLQCGSGCNEGDVFEDLVIHGHSVRLSVTNKLLVVPIDGRYRLRLIGATPDDVRVIQFRTNAWPNSMPLLAPSKGTILTLYAQLATDVAAIKALLNI
jgi:hypothetical protein